MKSTHFFRNIFIISYLGFITMPLLAQNSINGQILDGNTDKPINGAHVFIANTLIGTHTNQKGFFELNGTIQNHIELIVSHVGYDPFIKNHSIGKGIIKGIVIRLNPNTINLNEVNINSKKDNKWKRHYKLFERDFLGNTINASQCEILNPWVINISKKNEKMIGTASELIIIKNLSTGYHISFLLKNFIKQGNMVSYIGKPLFEEMSPSTALQQINWEKQRKTTYLGSRTHFLKSLIDNKLQEEGFKVYKAQLIPNTQQFEQKIILTRDDIYADGKLKFSDFLKVVYTKESEEDNYISDNAATTSFQIHGKVGGRSKSRTISNTRSARNFQTSYLFSRTGYHGIYRNGEVSKEQYLLNYGYWGWERIAELLPFEYSIDPAITEAEVVLPKQSVHQLNGFILSDLKLPYAEIKRGGPVKDGIPAIDYPEFILNDQNYEPKEFVLGVKINGISKAYPINIMNWHEIVNDKFGDQHVVITYCPLCGSGIAFSATIDNTPTTFGVSGLIYNSDVLLYDRQTESLWSQLEMQAISGVQSGKELNAIPTTYTTWGEWKKENPSTLLLSEKTGYKRNYNKSPYDGYSESEQLLFAINNKSDRLLQKDLVIGVSINGKHKAYPITKLKRKKKDIQDTIGGEQITIKHNSISQAVTVFNNANEQIISIRLYWFAWYAFHPDTDLY